MNQSIAGLLNKKQIQMTPKEIIDTIRVFTEYQTNALSFPTLEYHMQNVVFIFKNSTLKLLVLYLAISLTAYIAGLRFLYSFHLLDIVVS